MINTPPSERPQPPPPTQPFGNTGTVACVGSIGSKLTPLIAYGHDRTTYGESQSSPVPPRSLEDQYPAAATAAVALAQLHNHQPGSDWGSDAVRSSTKLSSVMREAPSVTDVTFSQGYASENEAKHRMRSSVELPPINHLSQQAVPPFQSPRPRELLPSVLSHSPPGRSSTLPPIQRKDSVKRSKPARPRKSSITENSRRPKHEKTKSKDYARRLSIEGRKAFSADPPGGAAAFVGKRWEDLVEAAASATEADSDRDLTPVRIFSIICTGYHSQTRRFLSLRLPSKDLLSHPSRASPTANPTKHPPSAKP